MLTHPIEKLIVLVSTILVENDYKRMLPNEIQCDLDNLVSVICIGNNGHAFKTHAPNINRSIGRLMDYAGHYHDSAMSKLISYKTPFASDWVKLLSALHKKRIVIINEVPIVLIEADGTSKSGYQLAPADPHGVTKTFRHVGIARLAQIATAATMEQWIAFVPFDNETIKHSKTLQSLAGYDDRFANFTSDSETQISTSMKYLMDVTNSSDADLINSLKFVNLPEGDPWMKFLRQLDKNDCAVSDGIKYSITHRGGNKRSGIGLNILAERETVSNMESTMLKAFQHVELTRVMQLIFWVNQTAKRDSKTHELARISPSIVAAAYEFDQKIGVIESSGKFFSADDAYVVHRLNALLKTAKDLTPTLIEILDGVALEESTKKIANAPWIKLIEHLDQTRSAKINDVDYALVVNPKEFRDEADVTIVPVDEAFKALCGDPQGLNHSKPFRHPDLERFARLIAHLHIRTVLEIPPIMGAGQKISQQLLFVYVEEDGDRLLAHRFISETASGETIESALTDLDWSFQDLMAYSAHLPADVIDGLPKIELIGNRYGLPILRELDEGSSIRFLKTKMHLVPRKPNDANPCIIDFVYSGEEPNVSKFLRYSAVPG